VDGGDQILMFPDKVGGWEWPNADVSKNKKKHFSWMALLFAWAEQKVNFFWNFWKNEPELVCVIDIKNKMKILV
jgi:hypothetical protein